MVGMTGTPGHISPASTSTARISSALIGEGGLSTALPFGMILTFSSAITRASVRSTSATS